MYFQRRLLVRTKVEEDIFSCMVCHKIFPNLREVGNHFRVHENLKLNINGNNGKKSSKLSKLSKNSSVSKVRKSHTCTVCSKSFSSTRNLELHKKVHATKSAFIWKTVHKHSRLKQYNSRDDVKNFPSGKNSSDFMSTAATQRNRHQNQKLCSFAVNCGKTCLDSFPSPARVRHLAREKSHSRKVHSEKVSNPSSLKSHAAESSLSSQIDANIVPDPTTLKSGHVDENSGSSKISSDIVPNSVSREEHDGVEKSNSCEFSPDVVSPAISPSVPLSLVYNNLFSESLHAAERINTGKISFDATSDPKCLKKNDIVQRLRSREMISGTLVSNPKTPKNHQMRRKSSCDIRSDIATISIIPKKQQRKGKVSSGEILSHIIISDVITQQKCHTDKKSPGLILSNTVSESGILKVRDTFKRLRSREIRSDMLVTKPITLKRVQRIEKPSSCDTPSDTVSSVGMNDGGIKSAERSSREICYSDPYYPVFSKRRTDEKLRLSKICPSLNSDSAALKRHDATEMSCPSQVHSAVTSDLRSSKRNDEIKRLCPWEIWSCPTKIHSAVTSSLRSQKRYDENKRRCPREIWSCSTQIHSAVTSGLTSPKRNNESKRLCPREIRPATSITNPTTRNHTTKKSNCCEIIISDTATNPTTLNKQQMAEKSESAEIFSDILSKPTTPNSCNTIETSPCPKIHSDQVFDTDTLGTPNSVRRLRSRKIHSDNLVTNPTILKKTVKSSSCEILSEKESGIVSSDTTKERLFGAEELVPSKNGLNNVSRSAYLKRHMDEKLHSFRMSPKMETDFATVKCNTLKSSGKCEIYSAICNGTDPKRCRRVEKQCSPIYITRCIS